MKCKTCGKLPVDETAHGCETDDEYGRRIQVICDCKHYECRKIRKSEWSGVSRPYYLKSGGVSKRALRVYKQMLWAESE